ncbi:hypothetical protein U9M48_026500 [Paspalum notatum var. saurae]|uniref:Uncharacterized protein n=1 Tax=Paspalum notatum var. saurae TaxID=547442 RepID=A0AAQ3WYX0_PASNO
MGCSLQEVAAARRSRDRLMWAAGWFSAAQRLLISGGHCQVPAIAHGKGAVSRLTEQGGGAVASQLPMPCATANVLACFKLLQALLPLFLRPIARFAALVAAGGPAATAATILHRAGALPRNRGLERLVRDDALGGRGQDCIASFVVGVMRCLC